MNEMWGHRFAMFSLYKWTGRLNVPKARPYMGTDKTDPQIRHRG